MTRDTTVSAFRHPETIEDPLTSVLREGARRLLAEAIEAEAETFLAAMQEKRLGDGRARFVRHGHGPERTIQPFDKLRGHRPGTCSAREGSRPRRRG